MGARALLKLAKKLRQASAWSAAISGGELHVSGGELHISGGELHISGGELHIPRAEAGVFVSESLAPLCILPESSFG